MGNTMEIVMDLQVILLQLWNLLGMNNDKLSNGGRSYKWDGSLVRDRITLEIQRWLEVECYLYDLLQVFLPCLIL